MSIIQAIYQYIGFAVVAVILSVIALMVVRLIIEYADLNPFGRVVMFVRRVTDPLVVPIRGGLRNIGMNPGIAPLITILLTILFGWFALQLAGSIFGTIAGVTESVATSNVVRLIGHLLYGALDLYSLLVVIYIIMSWFTSRHTNSVTRLLARICEPVLMPLRRVIPPLGPLDLSALILLILIFPLLKAAIAGTLLR
jgi:YggT family protein